MALGSSFATSRPRRQEGVPRPLSQEALLALFRALKDNIRVVVLNACFSRRQAEAVTELIDCAVGMKRAVGDRAAITFAAAFYRAVGFGRSVQTAFELDQQALLAEDIPGDKTPELFTCEGVKAAEVVLLANPR
jgi:hypothetical protein